MTADRRAPLVVAVLVVAAVVLAACRPVTADTGAWRLAAADVVHARGHTLDVYTPVSPGREPAPVVVLLHGCCGDRSDLVKLAEAVASQGVVTVNADWPGTGMAGRFPRSYDVAACAVRYARASAADHGGDPERVTVAGWSDGAMAAAALALAPRRWSRADCTTDGGLGTPRLVGVDGFYGWPLPVEQRYVTPRARRFLGGPPALAPSAWRDATPYHWVEGAGRVDATLIVRAAAEVRDDARRFARVLRRSGHGVRVAALSGGPGASVLSMRTELGRRTARVLASTAHRPSAAGAP